MKINRRYINIVREFMISIFKIRTGGAVLGFAWTLLHPLAMLLILYMLFSKRIGSGIPHYGLFLLIGILHWNLFSRATMISMRSITTKRSMLRNVYIPITAVVAGSILEAFLSFLFELLIVGVFIIVSGLGLSAVVFLLPFVVLTQLLLITGVSLVLASLNIYFQDIEYIWDVLLKLGFFVTPIFYNPSMFVSRQKLSFYLLNPLTQIILFARDILLFKRLPNLMTMLYVFLGALLLFLACYFVFKRFEDTIIERI